MGAIWIPWRLGAIKPGDVKMLMGAGTILVVPVGLAVLAWEGRLGNVNRVIVDRNTNRATAVPHAPVGGAGIVAAMVWPSL